MLVLASASETRHRLLARADVPFDVYPARLDDTAVQRGLEEDGISPRDIADALAESKALKVSGKRPQDIVLGCARVLDHRGTVVGVPQTPEELRHQLRGLSDDRHKVHSAVVAFEDGAPVWRHVGTVRMVMRSLSDRFIASYVERHWDAVRHLAGGYTVEEGGIRLFREIDGEWDAILGLPTIPILSWLVARGILET